MLAGALVVIAVGHEYQQIWAQPAPSASSAADTTLAGSRRQAATRDLPARRTNNPLDDIPLTSLSVTGKRPLFSPSRRPPSAIVAEPQSPPTKPVSLSVQPDRPLLTLLGTIIGTHPDMAVLVDTASQDVIRLRTGQAHRDWMLRSIRPGAVTFERGDHAATLELPPPDLEPIAPSAATAASGWMPGHGPASNRPPNTTATPAVPAPTTERFRRTPREL
jgi:general secretion pathway protein N